MKATILQEITALEVDEVCLLHKDIELSFIPASDMRLFGKQWCAICKSTAFNVEEQEIFVFTEGVETHRAAAVRFRDQLIQAGWEVEHDFEKLYT